MQFLEPSVVGLRSARHHLRSPDFAPTVTVFPMVHVGEAAFYEQVHDDAAAHDVILCEGITSKIATNLTRSYRWMRVERLGLVVQPKFDRGSAKGRVETADLSGPEFDALWRRATAWQRAAFAGAAPVFGVLRGVGLTRKSLAEGMSQNDLASREEILGWDALPRPLRRALFEAREARIGSVLQHIIRDNADARMSIAVIYGAAHMPAILHGLRQMGNYVPVDSDWMTVFSAS